MVSIQWLELTKMKDMIIIYDLYCILSIFGNVIYMLNIIRSYVALDDRYYSNLMPPSYTCLYLVGHVRCDMVYDILCMIY